jgi:hypothetical protein
MQIYALGILDVDGKSPIGVELQLPPLICLPFVKVLPMQKLILDPISFTNNRLNDTTDTHKLFLLVKLATCPASALSS